MAKSKKTKAPLLNLDEFLQGKEKIAAVSADDLTKIKESKPVKNKDLPSLTGRTMAEQLMAKPNEGRAVDVKGYMQEQKDSIVRTFKKELMRWARHKDRTDLRVKYKDQGDRIVFFYDKKKVKEPSSKKKSKS